MSNPEISTHTTCFGKALPALQKGSKAGYRTVGPSGKTTANATEPRMLLSTFVDELLNLANNHLEKYKDLPQSKRTISTVFPHLPLDSENDVVNASLIYIFLPIMETLRLWYEDQLTMHTEVTHKAEIKMEQLLRDKEAPKEAVIRCDLVFKSTEKSAKGPGKTIAVVEYKRQNMLAYKDFHGAILPEGASKEQRNSMDEELGEARKKTFLDRNGIPYSKQAAQYAKTTNCKHVALFDWENLVLLNFKELNAGEDSVYTAGKEADISWVSERQQPTRKFVQWMPIRKVFLGWMIRSITDFENSME